MPVTDLFISYGATLAPAGFRRIVLPNGEQAELNRGLGSSSSFLWYHDSPTRGDPIVELQVVATEDECPEGFEKIPRNMLFGSEHKAFLIIRRGKNVDPVGEIRIVYSDDMQPDEGFTRVIPPIYSDAASSSKSISLSFSTVSKDTPDKWSAVYLSPGDKCDIQDSEKIWHLGEVIPSGTTKEFVRVLLLHTGGAVARNLTLPRSSPRLAEPGMHSSARAGRGKGSEQGGQCELTEERLKTLKEQLHDLYPFPSRETEENKDEEGEGTLTRRENVWQETILAVEAVLSSSHPPALVPTANSFLQGVLALLARVLEAGAGLCDTQFHLLQKLLFMDSHFTWFYTHYGAGVVAEDAFLDVHRDYMLSGPAAVTEMSKGSSSGGQKSAWGSLTSTISNHFKSSGGGGQKQDKAADVNLNLLGCKLLVTNINYFASVGGFDALLTLLPTARITHVQEVLSLIKSLSLKVIRKQYLEIFLPKLQQNISKRLLTLEDKEYRDISNDPKKDFLILIWKDLEFMIRLVFKDIYFFEVYEMFTLNYAEKLISCQMLNLKIKGINILNDLIERTVRKETAKKPMYSLPNSAKLGNDPSWLTTTFLAAWLQRGELVELMLGGKHSESMPGSYVTPFHIHDEVLKRAEIPLLFLAKKGREAQGWAESCAHCDKQADVLLRVAGGGGASLAVPASSGTLATCRIAFSLLGHLVAYLSADMLAVITNSIRVFQDSSTPPSSLRDEFCKLIIELVKTMLEHVANTKTSTHNVSASTSTSHVEESKAEGEGSNLNSKGDKGLELEGLDVLWRFLVLSRSEESSGAEERGLFSCIRRAAADALATVLSNLHTRTELNVYLKKCMLHIDQFPSAEPVASGTTTVEQTFTPSPPSRNVMQEDMSMGSLLLLKRLIEMQAPPHPATTTYVSYYNTSAPKKNTGKELSRALIIKNCENNYDLLRVLIEYIGKCIIWKQVSVMPSPEYVVYTQSLQISMELLQVVLNNSELELTAAQVTGLWEGFNSGTADDMDMFFKWLHKSCPVESGGAALTTTGYSNNSSYNAYSSSTTTSLGKKQQDTCMSEEALTHVFLNLIGKHYALCDLTELGFEALEKLFRYINGKEKALLYSSNKSNFQVAVPTLVGFDILMKVYLSARDLNIMDLASKFLISLQVKLAPSVDKRLIWLSFTSRCLDLLQDLTVQSSIRDDAVENTRIGNIRKVGRLLVLLHRFFDGIYKSNIPVASTHTPTLKPHKAAGSEEVVAKSPIIPQRITVFWKREGGGVRVSSNAVYVFKKGTVSVGALRARLAMDLKVASPSLIRLVNPMRVTLNDTHDHMLLESIGISSFVDMTVLLNPGPDTEKFQPTAPASILADDPESDQMAPRKLMADDNAHLSLLFDLLSLPDTSDVVGIGDIEKEVEDSLSKQELCQISKHAWDLLALLPTNPSMLQEVQTLGGVLSLPPSLSHCSSLPSKISTASGSATSASLLRTIDVDTDREVDWPHVLSTEGLLRQHYKLQIVHDMITPLLPPATEGLYVAAEAVQRAREWSEAFSNKGGAECLRDLVMKTELTEMFKGNMFKQCLSLQIELLSVFLVQRPSLLDSATDSADSTSHVDFLLITKLVQFLQRVILGEGEGEGCVENNHDEGVRDEEDEDDVDRPVLKRIRSASQGSVDATFSSPISSPHASSSAQKLERKRYREARFEKYFSIQTRNTSAEKDSKERAERIMSQTSTEVEVDVDLEGGVVTTLLQDGQAILVDKIMTLLNLLLQERPRVVISVLLQHQEQRVWEDVLFVALLLSPSRPLREFMCAGVLHLCQTEQQAALASRKLAKELGHEQEQKFPQLTQFFVTHLLILLPHSALEIVHCSEFFKLLAKLLSMPNTLSLAADRSYCDEEETKIDAKDDRISALAVVPTLSKVSTVLSEGKLCSYPRVHIRQLSVTLWRMLVQHVPFEKSEEDDDYFLQGLLLVFHTFLVAISSESAGSNRGGAGDDRSCQVMFDLGITRNLVHEVFHNCLFSKVYIPMTMTSDSNTTSVQNLFNNTEGKFYPKCKSNVSRRNAFNLLNVLCTLPKNFKLLQQLLAPQHCIQHSQTIQNTGCVDDGTEQKTDIKHSAITKSLTKYGHAVSVPKSSSGITGMLNPSCICYLNSTLQQLFHVAPFRQGILQVETEAHLGDTGAKEDMMLQLQYLFASLQESDQAFADPKPFCYAFKDWDGRPTNVSIQQDASEFLAKFFQQVEGFVTGSKSENILKDTFAGSFSNELLATSADGTVRRSERAEPFYVLSVPVGRGRAGGNHCLTDALASFIRGEEVEYTWETEVAAESTDAGGKETEAKGQVMIKKEFLPTTKRASIKQLPNHLIIHLKRFDFNFETMQQVKINDSFEFPTQLDMFPFTVQGRVEQEKEQKQEAAEQETSTQDNNLPSPPPRDSSESSAEAEAGLSREECQYELAGVVVHVGTAHSGHYYSLVKDRRQESSAINSPTATKSWFELNDSFVTEFDVDDLESETFGGMDDSCKKARMGSAAAITAAKDKLRTKNAFMLVYDRVTTSKKDKVDDEGGLTANTAKTVLSADVPAAILAAIRRDNLSFWHTKTIFDPIYYDFLTETILPGAVQVLEATEAESSGDEPRRLLKLILSIVFGTFSQAGNKMLVQKWTLWLVDRMRRQPSLACWLLQLVGDMPGTETETETEKTDTWTKVEIRKQQWLLAMLLDSEESDIRQCGKKILCVAIVILASDTHFFTPMEPSTVQKVLQNEETPTTSTSTTATYTVTAAVPNLRRGEVVCMQVVELLLHRLLRSAQLQWRQVNVFFAPISVLAKNSPTCRAFMQAHDYLAILLSFFLGQDTPYPELVGGEEPKNHKSRAMCEGYLSADLSSLLQAVVALLPGGVHSKLRTASDADIFVESGGKDRTSKGHGDGTTNKNNDSDATNDGNGNEDAFSRVPVEISVSAKSFGMMRSSIFMYRLIKMLNQIENKPLVLQILQHILNDSKELSQTYVQIIVSAMKKEDGDGLKAPLRGALLLCDIADNLKGWRVSHVMQQVVVEIKSSLQYVFASDVSITMLLRICKHSTVAAEWLRLNFSARLTWLESYLFTRKGGMLPQKGMAWKPIKTASGSSSNAHDKSVQTVAAQTAAVKTQAEVNLHLLKRILARPANNKTKENSSGGTAATGAPVFSKFSRVSVLGGGYDSDDDPSELVGIRLQVQWKNVFYPGIVASIADSRSGIFMIHYDDGDKQTCSLKTKVWSAID